MHPSVLPASVSLYDARPFFEKALQYGVQHGIIDQPKLDAICADAPKGMVQIARYFGNEFLRPDLEKAKDRIVNLVSLYLESASGGDLRQAAESLQDHSFLSRSKGGSDLLKALLALPENTVFDTHPGAVDASGPPKGLAEWSLKSFADYQAELARRTPLHQEKGAALWLADQLGLDAEELEEAHTHAEAVIRTALLVLATRRTAWPDWVAFEKTVAALRKKYRPDSAETLAIVIPANLPPEFAAVVQALQQSVVADLPRILDSSLPARRLFAKDSDHHHPPLLGRYFWLEDMASEMDHHDRAISRAWDKATGGNCDDGSLLTLFVCVAAGAAPKTLLTEKGAAALVRNIQKAGAKPGFEPELARQYILDHAPVQYQEAYVQLWADFVDEAQAALQSDSAFAQQDALALLRRECNVKL
ncbi:MAG: hypothetical protein Q8K05_00460 [Polaromonas sp.]|nr:hypothetical protein [Polaromonas sp.]MDP2254524.1 hypothetical protein [Polaromonas sp.]